MEILLATFLSIGGGVQRLVIVGGGRGRPEVGVGHTLAQTWDEQSRD